MRVFSCRRLPGPWLQASLRGLRVAGERPLRPTTLRDLLRNAWAVTAACCMDDAVDLSTGRACDLRRIDWGNSTLDIPRMRCS